MEADREKVENEKKMSVWNGVHNRLKVKYERRMWTSKRNTKRQLQTDPHEANEVDEVNEVSEWSEWMN